MSSSTFEVTEAQNGTEKELNFGLEACEENGIGLADQVDGDIQKDHTYTKDPDDSDEEGKTEDSKLEGNEKPDASPEKRTTRNLKSSKGVRKSNPRNVKPKKDVPSKKEASPSKKGKSKKEVLTEESNKSDDNAKSEKTNEKTDAENQSKTSKRGKKRKVEEKENVIIDRSIAEEVQNINEGDIVTEASSESPAKKKNATANKSKTKKTAKTARSDDDDDEGQNLPKGWVRKVVVRKSGKTAGQQDVYIYSPDGIKFRSRPNLATYLAKTKSNLKLEDFNFSKKKSSEDSAVKSSPKKEKSIPAAKPKNIPEKKKGQPPTSNKRASKLLVKLGFSPKSKKGRSSLKKTGKQTKSPAKKGKASSFRTKTPKKKTA